MSELVTAACDRWAEIADRRLVGEPVSEEDERFAEQHAAECELCRAEADIWHEVDEPLAADHAEELVKRALDGARAERAEATVKPAVSLADARRRRVLVGSAIAAALALAAGAALWLRSGGSTPSVGDSGPRLASVQGDVRVDGRPASDGMLVRQGARLVTGNGRACIRWGEKDRACLDRQTDASLAQNEPAVRRIELAQGTLVSALDPLLAGNVFEVSSGGARVRVRGTVFSVTRAPAGSDVVVRVHEGVVDARQTSAGAGRDVVRGQELGLGSGVARAVPADMRRRELELVGIQLPEEARAAAPIQTPAVADEPAGAQTKAHKPAAAEADAGPSAADLLREAQALRARGNAAGAAAAYRRLQALHPRSPEAAASRVSLAELLLGPLGDPSGALAAYDAYLRGGGALRQEARYGRIQALRRLGRSGEERAAIEAFVRDYPQSVQARALTGRLADAAAE